MAITYCRTLASASTRGAMLFNMDANIHLHILASGSKGNACVVEGPRGSVLIDCGLSRRALFARAAELGIDMGRVQALLLTHEHADHVSGVTVFANRFDGGLYATAGTVAGRSYLKGLRFTTFAPGDELEVAGMRVRTFHTSHDVADPVGFCFECGGDKLGYCTDTGELTAEAREALRSCRILALESNHDVNMLKTGPYPPFLQARILGKGGHLSNDQAAEALPSLICDGTETVVAMHLSEKNNMPSIARRTLEAALDGRAKVVIAAQDAPKSVL